MEKKRTSQTRRDEPSYPASPTERGQSDCSPSRPSSSLHISPNPSFPLRQWWSSVHNKTRNTTERERSLHPLSLSRYHQHIGPLCSKSSRLDRSIGKGETTSFPLPLPPTNLSKSWQHLDTNRPPDYSPFINPSAPCRRPFATIPLLVTCTATYTPHHLYPQANKDAQDFSCPATLPAIS